MHRRSAVSTIGLSLLAGLAFPRRASAQAGEHIRLAGPLTEDITALYYAIKNGLFARAGLEIELTGTSSGAASTTAMIAGSYEIAKTSLLATFAAHLRDIPIVIVANEFNYTPRNPYALLQIAVDSTYRTGADLNGKTVGVPALGDLNVLATRAWVDKNGGDWKSLKFVEIPNSAMEAALQTHRVDAALVQSPQLDAALAAGTTKTLGDGYGAIAPSFPVGAFVARTDWATQHADALRRFNRVLVEAAVYVNAHAAETAPLVAELTKIPLANIAKLHRSLNATSLDPALVQALIDAAAKYEVITRGFPARDVIWT